MEKEALHQKKAKILVAEDDPNILTLLEAYLSSSDFEVVATQNGQEAYAQFLAQAFDLAILDIMMPEIDGLELAQMMREHSTAQKSGAAIGIILLTARGAENDRLTGFGAGVDDYIVKPFSPRELVARVKAVLMRLNAHSHIQEPSAKKEERIKIDHTRKRGLCDDKDMKGHCVGKAHAEYAYSLQKGYKTIV